MVHSDFIFFFQSYFQLDDLWRQYSMHVTRSKFPLPDISPPKVVRAEANHICE